MESIVGAGLLTATFAALGLLATALFCLDTKMEAGFARLDGTIDRVGSRLDELAHRMDLRFDRVDERLSAVEIGLARHLDHHA